MFLNFFFSLRDNKIPVGVNEYLTFLEALQAEIHNYNLEDFYYLARLTMVKNERHFDLFDQAFAQQFKGLGSIKEIVGDINEDWIKVLRNREFTEEEKALIEAMGGLEALMERFQELLNTQKERHEGGNTWIGTNGTSAFGNNGFNPEGIRVGGEGGSKSAVKVWDQRMFKDLADDVQVNVNNIKSALRTLRYVSREGIQEELDLDTTITNTSKNAGLLDIVMRAEKKNNLKILMFFDVGGSMDPYVKICERLFSAAKSEFKHLEYFYFHNCIYSKVWTKNKFSQRDTINVLDIINKYNKDYRLIIVGDAAMASYELHSMGGAIDMGTNRESGATWLNRLRERYRSSIWLNPEPESYWRHVETTMDIQQIFDNRMYPLTLSGLKKGIKALRKNKEQEYYIK